MHDAFSAPLPSDTHILRAFRSLRTRLIACSARRLEPIQPLRVRVHRNRNPRASYSAREHEPAQSRVRSLRRHSTPVPSTLALYLYCVHSLNSSVFCDPSNRARCAQHNNNDEGVAAQVSTDRGVQICVSYDVIGQARCRDMPSPCRVLAFPPPTFPPFRDASPSCGCDRAASFHALIASVEPTHIRRTCPPCNCEQVCLCES